MPNRYLDHYGATFGTKHSFRDFHLYPRSKPVISPPKPRLSLVDLPGSDGVIDLTEALTGRVQYANRDGTFEYVYVGERQAWDEIYSALMDEIHGKRLNVILDDAPDYYYQGRVSIESVEYQSKGPMFVTLTASFDPYKYEVVDSAEPWLWDPFNFESGIIREYDELTVTDSLELTVVGDRMPVSPVFDVSADMTVTFGAESYELETGRNRVPGIILEPGENILTFAGTGTVSIIFRGGRL